jgi:hypothetical protein
VTQNCKSSAFLPFDQSADHSSVPANFRTPCRRLVAGGDRQRFALDGRGEHYGSLAIPEVDARPIGPYTAVEQPVRGPCPRDQIAMIQMVLHRSLSQDVASSDVRQEEQGDISHGRQGKSAAFGPAHVVGGVEVLRGDESGHAIAARRNLRQINAPSAVGLRKWAVRYHE